MKSICTSSSAVIFCVKKACFTLVSEALVFSDLVSAFNSPSLLAIVLYRTRLGGHLVLVLCGLAAEQEPHGAHVVRQAYL